MNKKVSLAIVGIGILLGGVLIIFFAQKDTFAESLIALASPVENISDLNELIELSSGAKYVLLGESSHGTAEYYTWRFDISKRLIEEKGFSFIAIEADWPYIYHINRYVKGLEGAAENGREALLASARWPEWMWANEEFLELIEWLHLHNKTMPPEERVGLYGMDMQNLAGSIQAVLSDLEVFDTTMAQQAREQYACLERYNGDLIVYAQTYASSGVSCEEEAQAVIHMTEDLPAHLFTIHQNILAISAGEQYARDMVAGGSRSWNTRVKYMENTVERLSEQYGKNAKGILWAHNTHVGDARATEMAEAGMINIGQRLREKHGKDSIFILGFSTYTGKVVAGREWGAPKQIMSIPRPPAGTLESELGVLNGTSILIFTKENSIPSLRKPIGHRAKGVVYNPLFDRMNNYVVTIVPERYDALIFIKETTPLNPLSN